MQRETDKIHKYLERIGVPPEKVTFILGSTDGRKRITMAPIDIREVNDFSYFKLRQRLKCCCFL
jgi:hypothetical protein